MELDALIVTPIQAVEIEAINATFNNRRLEPVVAVDGRKVLPAALLTDCAPGGWWYAYATLLNAMEHATVELPEDET